MFYSRKLAFFAVAFSLATTALATCPAGKYWHNNKCATCPAGTFSHRYASSCTHCPSGTFSTGGAAQCSHCPGGSIPAPDAKSCHKCPGGSIPASNGRSCKSCPRGTIPNKASTQCIPKPPRCPAGEFLNGRHCSRCPAGTFSRYPGENSCSECPEDTFSAPGATSCKHCPVGHGCDARSGPGQCKPKACGPGQHKFFGKCQPCPRGTFETHGQCKHCPYGLTSSPGSTLCRPSPSHRAKKQRDLTCEKPGFQQCRVASGSSAYECIDTQNTLDSCGGCVAYGDESGVSGGRDCSAIEHANTVRCNKGSCVVESCSGDYKVSDDQGSCVPA
ncbi:hypothetical protein BD410DRAFT_827271 [Rickenella mellea]|uniref:Protein CPL1-like domain-containing protein n=1 Tax=Rickenella mellea TaxID=50990 RepID=A0A4Y7Q9Z5_9AGAM|nr:hypothetical protein BD410DRAFT_827271 [Rickenella mellea]